MNQAVNRLRHSPQFRLLSDIKWSESYTSLLLGIAVVGLLGFIIVSFSLNLRPVLTKQISSDKTEKVAEEEKNLTYTKTYKVEAGDTLWSISEKIYKSGYSFVDLARANNLANPNLIEAGMVLKIPEIQSSVTTVTTVENMADNKEVVVNTNKITGNSYKIQQGDILWDIAVRAYGDGFRWIDIAKANNLADPNLIHSDNILKIPR